MPCLPSSFPPPDASPTLPAGRALDQGGWAVAMGEVAGRPVVASSGHDGTVRVWDLASGAPIGKRLRIGWVWAMAVGELGGRAVGASDGGDGTVRVWDLASGAPIGEPLRGHDRRVVAVAMGEVDGRPVIASGSEGGHCKCGSLPQEQLVPTWQARHGRSRRCGVTRSGICAASRTCGRGTWIRIVSRRFVPSGDALYALIARAPYRSSAGATERR